MSWYGSHAIMTKADARALLPPRSCRRCVYLFRVMVMYPRGWWLMGKCDRCGVDRSTWPEILGWNEYAHLFGNKNG